MNLRLKGICLAGLMCVATVTCGGEAVFSTAYLGAGDFDAVVGLSSGKTFLNAVNLNGGALTINGVPFSGTSGANPAGGSWSFSGVGSVYASSAWATVLTGELGTTPAGKLMSDFIYGGNPGVMTLSNLTVGSTYVLTFYNAAFEAAGNRIQRFTTTSGSSVIYDEDMGAPTNGYGNLLRYTFRAAKTSESLTIRPLSGTMHLYGFSTEEVFSKNWVSGSDWTTAAWSPVGTPNASGANALFGAQGSPTVFNLDADRTVGHIQFDGTNSWTLSTSGGRSLALQADAGGVSVFCTPSGSHTISTALILNNDVVKVGAGTLNISGVVSGNRVINIHGGTLRLAGGANRLPEGATVVLANSGSSTLDLNDQNQTVASISGGYDGGRISLGRGVLTVGDGGSTSFGGAISGAGGGVTKQGAGVLRLDGALTYTGTTYIAAGTLQVKGPVARYGFESSAVDGSGHGHDGLAVGAPAYAAGKSGQAILLNGTSQYVTVPYDAAFALSNYSVSAWVYINGQPAVAANGPPLFSTRNGSDNTFDLQYYQPTSGIYKLHADIGDGVAWLTTSADCALPGALTGWSLITYVVSSGGYTIYVNDIAMTNGSVDGVPLFMKSGQELSIGAQKGGGSGYGSGGYLNAMMDNVVVFDHILSAEDVSSLYFARIGQLPANTMLKIAAGARLDLNGVNQAVGQLTLDRAPQGKGTYGATGSGAENTNDVYFAGSGILNVLHGANGTVIVIR